MTYRFDLHIHSVHSHDGLMRVEEIIKTAKEQGLRGIAVTDHDCFDGALEAMALAPRELLVIPGAELSTDRGHFLCYFLTEPPEKFGIKKRGKLYPFEDICAYVHQCGGLIYYAHPFRGAFKEQCINSVDGIEIFNGRNTAMHPEANDKAAAVVVKTGLPFSAGSDAHCRGEIGAGCRCFDFPAFPDAAMVRAALLSATGSYYGRYASLGYSAVTGLRTAVKTGNIKKLLRNTAKLGLSVPLDATKSVRAKAKPLAKGKVFTVSAEGREK